jgi:hypothetical protein
MKINKIAGPTQMNSARKPYEQHRKFGINLENY